VRVRRAEGHGLTLRRTRPIPLSPVYDQLSHDSRPHFAPNRTNAVLEI
jgi:hypothetical protein